MSTEVFDAYEEEFNSNCKEFQAFIDGFNECGPQDYTKKNELCAGSDASITKINNLLKEMEMEVRGYPSAMKKSCGDLLQSNKEQFATLKAGYNNAKFAWERSGLTNTKSGEDKKRMLDSKEKISKQNETIERLQRTIAETEAIGTETIEELRNNREKIESSSVKAKEVSEMADSANTTIKRMTKREWSMGFWS